MVDHLKKTEKIILNIIGSDAGKKHSLKPEIKDIVEIPIDDFPILQKLISSGEAVIRIAPVSISGRTFNIISTPSERWISIVYTFIMILGPIAGIVLSFIHSWYWLSLIVIAPVFAMKLNKKLYLHAVYNRSLNSEIVFSYLFTTVNITIELPGHGILFRKPAQPLNDKKENT